MANRNLNQLPLNDTPEDTDWLLGASGNSPSVFQKIPVGAIVPAQSGGGSVNFTQVNSPTTITQSGYYFTDDRTSNLLVTFTNPPLGLYIKWYNDSTKAVILTGFTFVDGVAIPANKGIQILAGSYLEFHVNNNSGNVKTRSGSSSFNWIPGQEPAYPYAEYVVLYLEGYGIDNSIQIVDTSTNLNGATTSKAITRVNNPIISTTKSKYGGSSLYFDGASLITTPNISDFNFSNSTFTIEAWINLTGSYGRGIVSARGSGLAEGWCIYLPGGSPTLFAYRDGQAITSALHSGTVQGNVWTHIAFVGPATNYKLYLNGIAGNTVNFTSGIQYLSGSPLAIGASSYAGESPFVGYIDSLLIHKGVEKYTSNFNPETDTYLG